MPYKGNKVDFTIILPKDNFALKKIIKELNN
jgi:serine protease inhibitor